jgi:hypothetical protein
MSPTVGRRCVRYFLRWKSTPTTTDSDPAVSGLVQPRRNKKAATQFFRKLLPSIRPTRHHHRQAGQRWSIISNEG